jgi:predicted DCC family thiol-disulfide oxidoreductase YuxK
MKKMNEPKNAIILFDGVCNFCNNWVNFIIEHDSKGYFKFSPLQSEIGEKLLLQHGINREETDSVVLIEDEKANTHSTAAFKIARNLDSFWKVFYIFLIVPKFIRDFFYRIMAKYRYKFFGQKETCMIPTPEIRERFLG